MSVVNWGRPVTPSRQWAFGCRPFLWVGPNSSALFSASLDSSLKKNFGLDYGRKFPVVASAGMGSTGGGAVFTFMVQMHRDVPRAAKFYSEGLGFTVKVCTPRWAELISDDFTLGLLHSSNIDSGIHKAAASSILTFRVADMNSTVTKLMSLGAELDGTIKYEPRCKAAAMRCIDCHLLGLYEPF